MSEKLNKLPNGLTEEYVSCFDPRWEEHSHALRAWDLENRRLVTEALAANDPKTAVVAMRQANWDKSYEKMGTLSDPKETSMDGCYVQQLLNPTEHWWEHWRECKSVLAKRGWRVKKTGSDWLVQLYTGVEQLHYFATSSLVKNLKYLPKGVTPMRFAGGSGKSLPRRSYDELSTKEQGQYFEAWKDAHDFDGEPGGFERAMQKVDEDFGLA